MAGISGTLCLAEAEREPGVTSVFKAQRISVNISRAGHNACLGYSGGFKRFKTKQQTSSNPI